MSVTQPKIISWPLGSISNQGQWAYAMDEQSVREVMLNILLTRSGERLMRPNFGAGLLDFIHQPNNLSTRHMIGDVIKKSLAQWEPRVEVEKVEVLPLPDSISDVHINVRYHMRHTLRPQELTMTLTLGQ